MPQWANGIDPFPLGQWPQIIVTTDANKMHQNVPFPKIKFQITTVRRFLKEFSRFNRRLSFVCLRKINYWKF